MKTKNIFQRRSTGYALMLVMILCAISLLILAGIMNRTSTISTLNDRNNKYTLCCTVAEAATEKVFTKMAADFQSVGIVLVTNNYIGGVYSNYVPTTADDAYWGNFLFSDGLGHTNTTYVAFVTNYAGPLPSQYTNLTTKVAPIYRVMSNVSLANTPDIVGTAQEDVLFALLPLDTYAIFYNGPLEFSWCATMTVIGRTHANDIICVGTSASLTFNGQVTSTKSVGGPERDGSTPTSWNQGTTFNAGYITNVPAVTLGLNMTNSHSIIEIPPAGEDPNSQQGQIRVYNQAQVLLLVTNLPVSGKPPTNTQVTFVIRQGSGGQLPGLDASSNVYTYIWTNYVWTNISLHTSGTNPIFTNYTSQWSNNMPHDIYKFLSVTNTFTDKREYQTNMFVTQIDVGAYVQWLSTNGFNTTKFTSDSLPTILYVADQRNIGTNKLAVVRLVNGALLPPNTASAGIAEGWSVGTQNPLYVKGSYNVTRDGTHFAYATNSTTNIPACTVPAALVCDAITILSANFNDLASSNSIGTASKSNTVNAAIITGNVPSTGITATTFSGGVHNLMRMQEDWSSSSSTLTLNTSIVDLWASTMATNQFRNPTGYSPSPVNPYYSPPTRQWGFDQNFYDPAKQPPAVPTALVPIRFNWTVPPPGTTNFNANNNW